MPKLRKLPTRDFESGVSYALARRKFFMAEFKGIPVSEVTRLFGTVTSGIDWRGCTKGMLADDFARGTHGLSKFTATELRDRYFTDVEIN